MKTKILSFLAVAPSYLVLASTRVYAAGCDITEGAEAGVECAQGSASGTPLTDQIDNITNTLLLAIGVIAVIMIIIGGIRYALSGGDEKNTKAAKDTILYAVIGLVIALLSFAIANFVLGRF